MPKVIRIEVLVTWVMSLFAHLLWLDAAAPQHWAEATLWLDANNVDLSQNQTLSNGSALSSWADLSGDNNNLSFISSSQKPILSTGSINSRDVVVFSSDGMRTQKTVEVQSIILVHKTLSTNYLLDFRTAISNSHLWFADLGPHWTYHTRNGIQMNQMHRSHFFNNELQISYVAANAVGSGIFFLHSRFSNNEFGSGKIAEILIFDRLLSDSELNEGEAYLASKWGLTAIVDSDGDGAVDASDGAPLDPSSQTNLATVTGTISYDGVIDGPAIVWAIEANGSTAATQTLANSNGNFSLTVEKGRGYDFKVFVDGTGDGYPQGYEVWKHYQDWNNTLGGFNLTQIEGNLSGVNFNLFDLDSDGDGFVNWHEYQAGSEMNDANSAPGLDFGLVGYWPFEGNASDLSGNGNHGTVIGASLGMDRHGQANKAYSFDGVDDFINIGNLGDFSSKVGTSTISLWLKTTDLSTSFKSVLGIIDETSGGDPVFKIELNRNMNDSTAPGHTLFYIRDDVGKFYGTFSNYNLYDDNWVHLTWVISNITNQSSLLYIDGTETSWTGTVNGGSSNNPSAFPQNWSQDFHLGASNNRGSTEGFAKINLDDIRIYDRALSATEVLALYNLEKPKIPLTDSNFQTAVNLWFSDEANAIATFGHISDWNTSAVTNMGEAFRDRTDFNGDISDWDVSSVTNMWSMFRNARVFNQDIGDWDTSNVVNMSEMFWKAHEFNQNINGWDVSSVLVMRDMFKQAYAFSDANKGLIHESFSSNSNWPYDWRPFVLIDDSNFHRAVDLWFDNQAEANATYGHISVWNTSAVTDMSEAFKGRTEFNEDISGWDVSNVTNMKMMFRIASAFNQPIGDWNTSSVKNMQSMFFGASSFNQPIGDWNVSAVTNMNSMFNSARNFNQPIGNWDVSKVIFMGSLFNGALSFNQPLGQWNTSSVTSMANTFRDAEVFNMPIGKWDLSSVVSSYSLKGMFKNAIAFNQDISDWNVTAVANFEESFANTYSLSDYNKGLIHESFSSNPNWPYDWSEFVADSNHTAPPTDHNQTKPEVPADHNVTQPPVVDGNQTTLPPIKDSNKTIIDPPKPELIVLAPMVATYGHQRDENNTITLYGKIRSDWNGTIEQSGFYIRTSMDGNDTVLLTDNHSKDDFFSITVSSEDSFYFQAFARNEKGETQGTWKRVGATIQSYPIDGVVETGDGWSTSEWFGDFRYFENGWAYHYGLGWVYLSADGEDGIWLWRKEHGWLWSNQATWPFLWSHISGDWIYLLIREKQDPVFFDYSTGRYSAENE